MQLKRNSNAERHKTTPKMEHHYENLEQWLLEEVADFLDREDVIIGEIIARISDDVSREESELHIRMAKAAMVEYRKTVK